MCKISGKDNESLNPWQDVKTEKKKHVLLPYVYVKKDM